MATGKRTQKGALRRKTTLIKKAHELGRFPGFEIALFIRRRGRITTYRSIEDDSWWPLKSELDSTYPVPNNVFPRHFDN